MLSSSDDSFWSTVLLRARNGSMLLPTGVGDEGSAGWQTGDPIPENLILCDLVDPPLPSSLPSLPVAFHNAAIKELDLSGNGLRSLPENLDVLKNLTCLFLGGGLRPNLLDTGLPSLEALRCLEQLTVHDTALRVLPELPPQLQSLRCDRCPLEEDLFPRDLPSRMTTLHLEGCPLPGSLDRPDLLPLSVRRLNLLEDLQLPDGGHMGLFFGTPLDGG
eukprot:gnl/TRDRNA2_/TRDRNA2_129112_c0_seq2.p1 gnl/TRDRNA2_/TRDRNA2_129112_c0~~gnl/TRDRNA2_/TRDRNA2_129112_c0_seq2.p1  ORF type:complete len:218 (+),score=17.55 gnl/TRDRNA2_/TRDRNA2_129112_c0_seq2:178-831(+)